MDTLTNASNSPTELHITEVKAHRSSKGHNAFICARHKKRKNNGGVVMVMETDICSPYGMACTECNNLVVAPKSSAYVSNDEVRHVWSCENCGREVELAVNLRIDATSKGLEARVAA